MPRLPRIFATLFAIGVGASAIFAFGMPSSAEDLPGVSAVTASKPSFAPGESITITVVATDDNGTLRVSSNLPGTTLSVTGCTVNEQQAVADTCSGNRTAVSGQGTRDIYLNTTTVDANNTPDPSLRVTLTLKNVPSCTAGTAVTVDADQDNNAGPDLVTINCIPNTPTPTPTNTATPAPTNTPPPAATATPVPPTPTNTPVAQVLSSGIQPPRTGDAGLK